MSGILHHMRTWILRFRKADRADFLLLRRGIKRVETRAATPRYAKIAAGDAVQVRCGDEQTTKRVREVRRFRSIGALLRAIPHRDIMPRAASSADVRRAYAGYGNAEKIRRHGILAFILT